MHPIELDATLRLAKTKLRSGQVAEAEAMYRHVLEEQPESAEAIHFLGLAAMTRGKLDEALTLVRRSVELDASKHEYHNNLATVLRRVAALTPDFMCKPTLRNLESRHVAEPGPVADLQDDGGHHGDQGGEHVQGHRVFQGEPDSEGRHV